MKKWNYLVFIGIALLLSGCRLQYYDTDHALKSPTNEKEVYNFQLGYKKDTLTKELGTPDEIKDEYIIYNDPSLILGFDNSGLTYFITSNNKIKTTKGIRVGSTREEIIEKYKKKDLYLFDNDGESWIYFFYEKGVKTAFKLKGDKVEQIASGVATLDNIFNYDNGATEAKTDSDIIRNSTYLTFKENFNKNNKKVLNADFLEYSSLGVVKNIPVPIGMSVSEIERKYGEANYVWEANGTVELYYSAFDCGFLVENGNDAIHGIKCPVELNISDLKEAFGAPTFESDHKISYTFKDYLLIFSVNESKTRYFILTKEKM